MAGSGAATDGQCGDRGARRAVLRWSAAVVALVAAARPAGVPPGHRGAVPRARVLFRVGIRRGQRLETAAAATGCAPDAATGRCTCPETVPPVSVCTNWAVNLVRYYYPHHGAAAAGPDGVEFNDFAGNLSRSLAGVCDTYGGQLLEQRPPDGVPADTFAARATASSPPAASTAGVTLAVAVGTTLFAVVVLNGIVDTPGLDSAPAPVASPLQIQESTLWNGVVY